MDVSEEVKRIISKVLRVPVDQLTSGTELQNIGAQSLDVVEIIFELEEKFDISIPVPQGKEEGLEFDTIEAMMQAVQRLTDVKTAA